MSWLAGLASVIGPAMAADGSAPAVAPGAYQMPGVAVQQPGAPSTPGQAGIAPAQAAPAPQLTAQQKGLTDSLKRPASAEPGGYVPVAFEQVAQVPYQQGLSYQNLSHLMQGQ